MNQNSYLSDMCTELKRNTSPMIRNCRVQIVLIPFLFCGEGGADRENALCCAVHANVPSYGLVALVVSRRQRGTRTCLFAFLGGLFPSPLETSYVRFPLIQMRSSQSK